MLVERWMVACSEKGCWKHVEVPKYYGMMPKLLVGYNQLFQT